MKKKKYITPNVEIVRTEMQQVLLPESKIKSSMDSDESDWEPVDDNNTSGSGGNSTRSSRPFNYEW